jgi:hypothetical protein
MTKLLHSPSADLAKPTFAYYDLKKNWRKVKRHVSDPALNDILVEDFNKFSVGVWNKPFRHGDYPAEFETCMWWPDRYDDPKFRFCAYMSYVKHGACHWLVNFALGLAMLVEPTKKWRIITSDEHSTVWDGHDTLFEFNWQAFGVSANECFRSAYDEELPLGTYRETDFAPPNMAYFKGRPHELEERDRFIRQSSSRPYRNSSLRAT